MKASTDDRSRSRDLEAGAVSDPNHALAPVRLLAGGGSPLERRLLESARTDHISDASRQHLARALRVPMPVPIPPQVPASAPAALWRGLLGSARVGKCAALAGLGAFALLAAWGARHGFAPHSPALAAADSSREPVALAMPPIVAPPVVATVSADHAEDVLPSQPAASPAPPAKRPERARSTTSRAPAVTASAAAQPGLAAEARGGLRDELRALEAIQSSLRAGRSSQAERALDDYARRFPEGELALEAQLLGVDVALARGDRRRALARARQLLARPDAARYRDRLEALSKSAGGGSEGNGSGSGSESTTLTHSQSGGH